MRKSLNVIATILVAVIVVGVGMFATSRNTDETNWGPTPNILVVTTNITMAHFVKIVSGDINVNAGVTPIVSSDIEPHEYEPSTSDVAFALENADVFIAVGSSFDGWAKGIVDERERLGKTNLVVMDWDAADPHFWLDPITLSGTIDDIASTLALADPEHAAAYAANAAAYQTELAALDAEFRTMLAACNLRDIITTHGAFGFLAARYDINDHAVTGISPEDEPTARDLARLADLMREKGITTVFVEATETDDLAKALASEVRASIAAIDTFETERPSKTSETDTADYLEIMRDNLAALASAMVCR